jgi:LysM repeat protein
MCQTIAQVLTPRIDGLYSIFLVLGVVYGPILLFQLLLAVGLVAIAVAFRYYMPIETRILLAGASFSLVFASGSFEPVAADSHSSSQPAIEESVVLTAGDEVGSGFVPLDPGGLDPAPEVVAIDLDPWPQAVSDVTVVLSPALVTEPPSFPLDINPQVQRFIDRYTGSRRDIVNLWLSRSTRYLAMIRSVLRTHNLPEDLAFVAMIESGFNPLAVSRAGATGLWQFMAGTARQYGLRVDQWVDERLDPEKSTTAAAAYLRDLYQQFGSWALAKAAYNAGEVTVLRAIRALGTTDFWTLARSQFLRQETKEFVPAIHAATVIGRDPARFGFEPGEPEAAAVETVRVPAGTSLRKVATQAGLRLEALSVLNPVLVKGVTPPGATYELRVPAENRDRIVAALTPMPAASARGVANSRPASRQEFHVVRPRETLSDIAKQHGVSVVDVIRWNNLDRPERIRPGDRLRVAQIRLSAADHLAPTAGR